MNTSIWGKIANTPYFTQTALSQGSKKITYEEFKDLVRRMARNLSAVGIKKGDVVTLALPNTIEAVISFYAINAVGGIANVMHPSLPNLTLIRIQEETHSQILIGLANHKSISKKITCCSPTPCANSWESFMSKDSEEIEYNLSDSLAVYLHSGGTTDKPKTILLSSSNLNSLADGLTDLFTSEEVSHYKSLTALPMFHGFGLGAGIHTILSLGGELVLIPKFDKEKTPSYIVEHEINMILGVPLIFQAILSSPVIQNTSDLSFIKHCYVGGDKTPITLLTDFNNLLQSKGSCAKLCEGYGLTECVSVCAVNRNNNYRLGSIGLPISTAEISILSENGKFLESESIGEICVSGDIVMQRYLSGANRCFINKSGKIYLRTGDYGYRDEDGYYYFVDRKKRIVKISGVTVFPSEVELILRTNFAVSAAYVTPISKNNQKLKAFVVTKKGAKITEEELINYCKSHLMKWAVPEKIIFLDALPLTPIGKIDVKDKIFQQK